MKELYRILSSLKKDGPCGRIDLDLLKANRRNLLVGSCGRDGELYEAVLNGEKTVSLDLLFPTSFRDNAVRFLEQLSGVDRIACAGTVNQLWDTRANDSIAQFERQFCCAFDDNEQQRILDKMIGTKRPERTTSVGYVILPEGLEFEDFTPICSCQDDRIPYQTHLDFRALNNTLFKQDVLPSDWLELLLKLQDETGVRLQDIPFNDPDIYSLLCGNNTDGLPLFDRDIVVDMYQTVQPRGFGELVKIQGLCHGTNVWTDNGEYLLTSGVSVSALPTTREDIFYDLQQHTDRQTAYHYFEGIWKGRFARGAFSDEEMRLFKEIVKPLGNWYYDYCRKIQYMFSKAYAVECALVCARLAWFKAHYPDRFLQSESLTIITPPRYEDQKRTKQEASFFFSSDGT